jgi:hypothetical protein
MILPKCSDNFLRSWEMAIRRLLFEASIEHDQVIQPWLMIEAVKECSGKMRWGVPVELGERTQKNGAAAFKPVILEEDDFYKLKTPYHKIDEKATIERYQRVYALAGDILPIHIDRDPSFKVFAGDISSDIIKLLGFENFMLDLYDRPEWIHKILVFMRDGILKVHQEAEDAGDFSSVSQRIQGQPYSSETAEPKFNDYGKKRSELFVYMAAQEFTTISEEMYDEFMLQYQIPILEKFKYSAYGCCEDLTRKIKYLKKVKNLRQIAITPFSDAEKCAEQIGQDYAASWRPNPSLVICNCLDEDFVRKYIREHLNIFKKYKNRVNINLKDLHTYQNNPGNIIRLNRIIKEEIIKNY